VLECVVTTLEQAAAVDHGSGHREVDRMHASQEAAWRSREPQGEVAARSQRTPGKPEPVATPVSHRFLCHRARGTVRPGDLPFSVKARRTSCRPWAVIPSPRRSQADGADLYQVYPLWPPSTRRSWRRPYASPVTTIARSAPGISRALRGHRCRRRRGGGSPSASVTLTPDNAEPTTFQLPVQGTPSLPVR
jgi:hypothetical protein